ncbi:unnamed protein product [Allacma fusca]|uniref:Uncharacterized protein n=1 Tax=Allacma fusca TaxID=39272 RepID=A0A8J2LCT3_9HEXA|nr:unnamed protein product [Allacma fusca]
MKFAFAFCALALLLCTLEAFGYPDLKDKKAEVEVAKDVKDKKAEVEVAKDLKDKNPEVEVAKDVTDKKAGVGVTEDEKAPVKGDREGKQGFAYRRRTIRRRIISRGGYGGDFHTLG